MKHSFIWQGRNDGEGEAHLRIHQVINTQADASYALIGFGSDEGVKRNKGRLGAADAPDVARLAGQHHHTSIPTPTHASLPLRHSGSAPIPHLGPSHVF